MDDIGEERRTDPFCLGTVPFFGVDISDPDAAMADTGNNDIEEFHIIFCAVPSVTDTAVDGRDLGKEPQTFGQVGNGLE